MIAMIQPYFEDSVIIKELDTLQNSLESIEYGNTRIWSLRYAKKWKIIFSSHSDKKIRAWFLGDNLDFYKNRILEEVENIHTKTIRSITLSPCEKFLVFGCFDSQVSVWKIEASSICSQSDITLTLVECLQGHENEVKCVCWHPHLPYLATCSRDHSVWIWKLDEDENYFENESALYQHKADVKKVAFHPEKMMLVSSSYDNSINIYLPNYDDDYEWYRVDTLYYHENTVWSICFSQNGKYLVSSSGDLSIAVWDTEKFRGLNDGANNTQTTKKVEVGGEEKLNIHSAFVCCYQDAHQDPVYDVKFLGNDIIVSVGGDNSLKIFQFDDQNLHLIAQKEQAHIQDVNAIEIMDEASGIFVTGGDDGLIKIWKLEIDRLSSTQ